MGPEEEAVYRTLRAILPKVVFSGIALGDVVQFLRDVGPCNIHVKWDALRSVGIDERTPVTFSLANVTFQKALETVLTDVGDISPLGYVVDEGVITISTKDDLSYLLCTRVYNVRQITGVPDAGNVTACSGVPGNAKYAQNVQDLVRCIRSTVAPESWEPAGPGAVRAFAGDLIVTQTPEIHQMLCALLGQLAVNADVSWTRSDGVSVDPLVSPEGEGRERFGLHGVVVVVALVCLAGVLIVGLAVCQQSSTNTELEWLGMTLKTHSIGVVLCGMAILGLVSITCIALRNWATARDQD